MAGNDWTRFTDWEIVLPPNRPGASVVRTIHELLRRRGPIRRAGVLGSTPEFLDLLASMGVGEVLCFEASVEFNRATRRLRRFPATERLVEGDWLDTLPRFHGELDVVLSDFTLGNVAYDAQERLLCLVAAALVPHGRFIDRVLTYRRPCYRYRDLAVRFRSLPTNLVTLNEFNAKWLFCGERVCSEHLVDTTATYDWSLDHHAEPGLRWLIENCERLSPRGARWYYGKPWAAIGPLYERQLRLLQEYDEPRSSAYYGWAYVRESVPRGEADGNR